ncbi:hypothetical protein HMPREF0183_0263 [Brevibacterium mcbrellneri ATCC 49030]|uniref:DUF1697 domain-containing protein n=1 Tax=Brevibacterium mcbrellneri ATCC 49030 TaxID=585530 RepID=D4YK03_9MICO|nr:DUF1697 domain-containing protein [Brevibacterium mcbrellneri]EFG48447.1 hypothetical protein HMPREF0183_0263 [Brevibacterium mcbrellneri ATCC 49030]
MNYVALFRNLNLGHPGSPTATALVDAFGGPSVASCFQTNGTVVFDADDPEPLIGQARNTLTARGFHQSFATRSLTEIASLLNDAPEVDPAENVYRLMVSFFDTIDKPQISVPLRSPDGLVEVRGLYDSHAWSACWKPKNTAGNVTGFLESLLEVPVTTRTMATLERLARKYGAAGHGNAG